MNLYGTGGVMDRPNEAVVVVDDMTVERSFIRDHWEETRRRLRITLNFLLSRKFIRVYKSTVERRRKKDRMNERRKEIRKERKRGPSDFTMCLITMTTAVSTLSCITSATNNRKSH